MGVQVPVNKPLLQFKAMDKWLKKPTPQDEPFSVEMKHIKDILKEHDTQNHLLPLRFHRHIKPPVHPPKRHFLEKEVVAGKKVPFSKTMAKRIRMVSLARVTDEAMALKTIFETEEYEAARKMQHSTSIFMLN
ncbi:hypothetical protein DYB37_008731 [Aphanomyces astaci]|uniref:Uncharacterized protein n=1 Tax=Aphanomyces astaci TaxID=112090 RepID=A0A397ACK8_APHAT|nr:hypothetical protein AaE_011570 [Aphanomyces astaci]RHY03397.1 hypothetical protein DYB25_006153 [Aphanomyces astaci]RHY16007.1 hypothetical protein DYB36_005919 [Aphanomyces astaci]RHY61992.1 hypothetical protein DYB30_001839 [Aphanomyces astaci]RHY72780.1 hypothetical protein DYB38_010879 [Aphanomyces astaci]